ncbi:MAG: hypothetical protein CME60_14545 [Halobacteriovoraceae bacterium]|nr:hypothetical protein [Halobacteriovoraceae bacterium]|tara:strand:+ start:141 stop:1181 length:1041 start_codon:yes stop_codon:yes gene_type:complete
MTMIWYLAKVAFFKNLILIRGAMKSFSSLTIFLFLCFIFTAQSRAQSSFCIDWEDEKELGQMPPEHINESSGLVASRQFGDRLYHINDSGDGPFFYVTDLQGNLIQKVQFMDDKPRDIEDLTIGIYKGEPALFLSDMGDNNETRPRISLYIIKELEQWPERVELMDLVDLTYPDGSHDAESVSYANGEVFFLTKKVDWNERRAIDAGLYSVAISTLEKREPFDLTRIELTKKLSLNLPFLLYNYNLWGRIATGMDVHPDGTQFAILTYGAILVVNKSLDLLDAVSGNVKEWKEKKDYLIIRTPYTPQQEAVAYAQDGNSLLFTTEYKKRFGKNPIYSLACKKTLQQ